MKANGILKYFAGDKALPYGQQWLLSIFIGLVLTAIPAYIIAGLVRSIESNWLTWNDSKWYLKAHWDLIFWGGVFGQLLQIAVILLIIFYS